LFKVFPSFGQLISTESTANMVSCEMVTSSATGKRRVGQ
jgi:hypothetical protein